MLYRIRIDAAFEELPPREALLEIRRYIRNHWVTIKPGQLDEERGYIILEECHHDETPPSPCITLEEEYSPEG